MAKGRKYILNSSSVVSYGLGTSTGTTTQCSLLNSFTVTGDTIPRTTCTYPLITVEQLETLSDIDYDNRVIDYLDYLDIESIVMKNMLFIKILIPIHITKYSIPTKK